MNRLTKKYKEDYFVNTDNRELTKLDIENDHNSSQIMRNKLGQLEDIEEELGIDLLTLFKVLKDGIYVKINGKINYLQYVSIFKKRKWHLYSSYTFWGKYDIGLIKDYGKTWALTKEELQ